MIFLAIGVPLPPMATLPPKQSNIPLNVDDYLEGALQRGDVVGSWGFDARLNFSRMSAEESNVWVFEQVFNFLRSFFGVIMPDSMEIMLYNGKEQITRTKLDQMTFLDELMLIMKNLKEYIWVLKLNLSIVGFLRSDWNPNGSIRIRIQEPATLMIWAGPDETGFQAFTISYSLFSSQKIQDEEVELWSVNQPLLEKALQKWEKQTGRKIDRVKGNSDKLSLYQHGFKQAAPSRVATKPKPKEPEKPPNEDFIPDFEDLDI